MSDPKFAIVFMYEASVIANNYRLMKDDMTTYYTGSYGNEYFAVDIINDYFFVSESNVLKRRSLANGALQYTEFASTGIPPRACFIDKDDYLWAFDYGSNIIRRWSSDLQSRDDYTIKGGVVGDQIYAICMDYYGNYLYLKGGGGFNPNRRFAKIAIDNLNGGDPEWEKTTTHRMEGRQICVDVEGHLYAIAATASGGRIVKLDSDTGVNLFPDSIYGGYGICTHEDSIFVGYSSPDLPLSDYLQKNKSDGSYIGRTVNQEDNIWCCFIGYYGKYLYTGCFESPFGGANAGIYKWDIQNDWGDSEPRDGYLQIAPEKNHFVYGCDPTGRINFLLKYYGGTMAEVSGRHLLAALKKGAAWNTDIQIGVNDGFLFLNENVGVLARESVANEEIGAADAFISCTDKLNSPADDRTIEFELIFEMFEFMTALGLGTAGSPSAGTDGYTHTLRPTKDLEGIFATFAKEPIDASIMHVYPSIKVKGLEFSGAAGEIWKCTSTIIPSKFTNSPGVIVAADFNNVTFRKKCGRINFNQSQIWMNAQAGGALATGDAINPNSLSFSFMREMDAHHVSTNDVDADAFAVQQPIENGYPDIKMTLEFPKYSADTYVTALHADSHYKMKINFVGALIGTDYWTWSVYFPNMEVLNAEVAFDGAGKVVHPLEFRLKSVSAAPTGMSYGDPFYMEIINTITTDLLA